MNRTTIKENRLFYIWVAVSLLGAVLVSAKMLLAGFTADEEYQLVLGYRLATGDRLFTEVWDTIQTSGFLCAFFTKIYLGAVKSTEGILVYLRVCGIILQALCAYCFYRTLRKRLGREYAYTLAVSFFCFYTKLIASPDFSNMQMWFLTLMCCALWEAMEASATKKTKALSIWLCAAAFCFCMAVLSTACVILVPIVAVFLLCFSDNKVRAELVFWGTCLLVGGVYLIGILSANSSAGSLIANMRNTLSGDSTHMKAQNIVGQSKWITYLNNLGTVCLWLVITLILAKLICVLVKRSKGKSFALTTCWIIVSLFVTAFKWVILNEGYDTLKLYIPVLVCCGIYRCLTAKEQRKRFLLFAVLCGIGAFLNVLFISNVPLTNNLAFLGAGAFWALVAVISDYTRENRGKEALTITVIFCLTLLLGTGFTLTSGPFGNNVFALNGIVRNGPARNVLMSKDVAWVYHSDYIDFEQVVPEGSNVLIVTDFFRNASVTSCYLLNNVNISHYSVNSTPTFSAKLEEYWEMYPEKTPEVIMVNTYTVSLSEGDWVYDYLKREFDTENAVCTENATYYFRKNK